MSLQEMIDMIEVQEENDMYDREYYNLRLEKTIDKMLEQYFE